MSPIDSTFYADLQARGMIKQVTDPALEKSMSQSAMPVYIGFDPTSDSLHVGSLMGLLLLKRFQQAGHQPIAVVGGATGMIGDPSGKSQERSLLGEEELRNNVKGITQQVSRFLDFEKGAKVVSNADWFKDMPFVDFLRDIGKHFTINHMIAKESVRARLEDREHGISYTEFSYMILQAYDFHFLNRKFGCRIQAGGSDQWGNITAGTELIRRIRAHDGTETTQQNEVFGLTHPLVTKSDGTKFGKTEKGALWLDAKRTSPYQFYQFFIQSTDADVVTYLKYFTFLPIQEILKLENAVRTEPEKRLAQLTLAREVTTLVHGADQLAQAEKASQALFGDAIREVDEATLLDLVAGAPVTRKSRSSLEAGLSLIDALVDSGLCASKGAARKDVTAGGIYVNNVRVSDAAHVLKLTDQIAGGHLLLRKGKKTYHLLHFS